MHPADHTYRNQVVRLPDLTVTSDVISGVTFEGCTLIGPAVIALLGQVTMTNSGFDGDSEGILWPLGDREHLIGAIGLQDCTIVGCRFQRVGIAYTSAQEELLRAGGLIP